MTGRAVRVVVGWILLGVVAGSILGWASVPYPETTPEEWRGYGAQTG